MIDRHSADSSAKFLWVDCPAVMRTVVVYGW